MTKERWKEHFESGDGGFIIRPADGSPPYRPDGKPLTDYDRAILAGKDPLGDEADDEPVPPDAAS